MMGFEVLLLLLIVGAIIYALGWRPNANGTAPKSEGESALDILMARYARGEINQDEYAEMRRQISV
jgi:putative membrane protein